MIIRSCASSDIDVLTRQFAALRRVGVTLQQGVSAYVTLPRTADEWRLPGRESDGQRNDELLMLPVRDEYYTNNAYLAVVPQPIIMHQKVAKTLEDYALRMFRHFPEENSLARREYGVPMLIGRFDVIVDKAGNIQICELDDVCSLWPALLKLNPIAASYVDELENQLGMPIYTSELFQYEDGPFPLTPRVRENFSRIFFTNFEGEREVGYLPRSIPLTMAVETPDGLTRVRSYTSKEKNVQYFMQNMRKLYLHNEDNWRGDISEAWLLENKSIMLDDVALSIRAYRDMPGFKEHLDRFSPRSITMAWERDSKWSLVAENLAMLATDLDTAVEFGKKWQAEHPGELLVFKTIYSARTDHTAIYSSKGTKLKGVSSAAQIRRKFGDDSDGPIVIQPYKEPDSLAAAGVSFIGSEAENGDKTSYADRKIIRGMDHIGSPKPGERVIAGMESHFAMIFRSFVIYLPKEKRLVHIGGIWQATDGRIVHGGAHSVAGPLYIDGLMGHPDSKHTAALKAAEKMVGVKL